MFSVFVLEKQGMQTKVNGKSSVTKNLRKGIRRYNIDILHWS